MYHIPFKHRSHVCPHGFAIYLLASPGPQQIQGANLQVKGIGTDNGCLELTGIAFLAEVLFLDQYIMLLLNDWLAV